MACEILGKCLAGAIAARPGESCGDAGLAVRRTGFRRQVTHFAVVQAADTSSENANRMCHNIPGAATPCLSARPSAAVSRYTLFTFYI